MDFPVALASFGLLFLMELGDKTQLIVLSLSARTRQVVAVFVGGTLALTSVTLIGVGVGAVAGELIPMSWLSQVTGVAFVAIGGYLLWSSRHGSPKDDEEGEEKLITSQTRGPVGTLLVTFGLLFIAEMGDKSQLSVVSMTVKTGSPLSVFLGASLALTVVTLLGVLAGKVVTRIIPLRLLSRSAALLFIVIGSLTLAGIP